MPGDLVIINQDSGYLMIDLANAFTEKGYSVTLITGRLVVRNHKLGDTVKVTRIIKYNRESHIRRILTWSIAFAQILMLVLFRYRKSKLLLVTNPPLALFLPFFVRNRYSLMVFDVFPDAISELGIMKEKSPVIRAWRKLNHRIYKRADSIFVITEGMKELVEKYAGEHPINVIPLWSDNGFIKPINPSRNPFIIENKLSGKFIVMYSGNIGTTQNLEVLIDLAKLSSRRTDILFLIIGDGIMSHQIEDDIKSSDLTNCIMMPWQEPENMPFSLAASNLAIVSMGKLSSSIAIPSKLYNFLSAGSPILGIASHDSELAGIIKKLKVGKCFEPSEKLNMLSFINSVADDSALYHKLTTNSLKAASHFTPENAVKTASIFHEQDIN
jgi:glycosyltransferase involved in cell wall biosynthesis